MVNKIKKNSPENVQILLRIKKNPCKWEISLENPADDAAS